MVMYASFFSGIGGFDLGFDRAGMDGRAIPDGHTLGVRRLTPVECCRLQGFPDDWNDGQPDGPRYKQLGNAVSVPVAQWIGRRLVAAQVKLD